MRGVKAIIITGTVFGRLTIISESSKRNGIRHFLCKCNCGKEIITSLHGLKNGNTKSCGCVQIERTKNANISHGGTGSRLYKIWRNMRHRCSNTNNKSYKDYGGRGISVCKDWASDYLCFMLWALASGYSDDLTIERIDVNGNYNPENCTWIPYPEQLKNKRNTVRLTLNGVTKHAAEWSTELGISSSVISYRKIHGWSDIDILTRELNK